MAFTCSSCNEFVLEFVEDARGREVMPVRWHGSITSFKTTSHRSFFPPMLFWPGRRASLNPRKEVLPFTLLWRTVVQAFVYPVGGRVWRNKGPLLHKKSRRLRHSHLLYSIHVLNARKLSRVLSRRDAAADPAGHSGKSQGWNHSSSQGAPLMDQCLPLGLRQDRRAKNKEEKKEMKVAMGQG